MPWIKSEKASAKSMSIKYPKGYDHQECITLGASMKNKKQRAIKLAKNLIAKNYFTEIQKIMLLSVIELSERKR